MNPSAALRAGRTRCSAAITTLTPPSRPASQTRRRKLMSTVQSKTPPPSAPRSSRRPFRLIGELINHSFARAARAWRARDVAAYAKLAKLQADLGADYITLNIDGTQSMRVTPQDMFHFLPELIPAIQEVTNVPIAFD